MRSSRRHGVRRSGNNCTICLPDNLARAFDVANQPDSAITAYDAYIVRQ